MKIVKFMAFLSFLCISLSICHALDNKKDNMNLESIAGRNEINKYYAEVKTINQEVSGSNIEIKLYKIKDDKNSILHDRCPYCFAEISAGNVLKYQALGRYLIEEPVIFLKKPENILCLHYEWGGTGSASRGYFLLSLEKDTLLENIGVIKNISKETGEDHIFYNWNNIFESTKYFSHADSPGIREYFKIQKAKLFKDNKSKFYEEEVTRLQKEIAEYPKEKPREYISGKDSLLHKIITKYLYNRFMDKEKEGWEALKKELHFYGDTYFQLDGDFTKDKKIEIKNLEADLRRLIDENKK